MGKAPGSNLAILLGLAADRADMLVDDGTGQAVISSFFTTQVLIAYANMELAALWDVLINAHEDYCVYRHRVNVTASQEDYLLPEDFYKCRKVFPIVNGKRCKPLRKFNLDKLGEADSLAAVYTSRIEGSQYSIRGLRLWIHPEPTNAATLELWYVPQFRYLDNKDDLMPWQFPNGWEEYVIEGVAARMLEKEESDSSPMRRQQEKILQRILIMAEDRDVGEPHQMQDTEGYL